MPVKREAELTEKEKQILKFINDHVEKNGSSPSVREIGKRFGIRATSHVTYYLKKLENKKFIKRNRKARGIVVAVKKSGSPNTTRLPIVARIPAGIHVSAIEDVEGYMHIDNAFASGSGIFALRIQDNSMKEEGIFHGDIVVISPQNEVEEGEIVVARIEDKTIIKKFKELQDKPIVGKVVTLVRNYNTE